MPGKNRESCLHLCGGLVKLVKACLSASKDRESRFHHSGGLVRLVQVVLVPGKIHKAVFTSEEVL